MKEKFKNVEFLRFIFAIFIVFYHFRSIIKGTLEQYVPGITHCNICVEFFFIIAGFFLFSNLKTNTDTVKFALKRFFRLAPLIWFSTVCFLVLSLISKFHFSFDNHILRMLLLSNIGFSSKVEATVIHWFIPVLFWCSLFYFYISKIFDKKYLNLIMWLIVIFSCSFALNYMNFTTGGQTKNIYYVINIGVMRGLAAMGVGYFISMLYNSDFLKTCSKKMQIIISSIEIYLVTFLAHYLLFTNKIPGKTPFLYVVMFSALFFLFLRKKGIISKLLDNNLFYTLGASSYAIYVMHPVVSIYFKHLVFKHNTALINQHALVYILIVGISAIAVGILTHYFVEKPINKWISSKQIL